MKTEFKENGKMLKNKVYEGNLLNPKRYPEIIDDSLKFLKLNTTLMAIS